MLYVLGLAIQKAGGDTKDLKNPSSPITSCHDLAHHQTLCSMTVFKIALVAHISIHAQNTLPFSQPISSSMPTLRYIKS